MSLFVDSIVDGVGDIYNAVYTMGDTGALGGGISSFSSTMYGFVVNVSDTVVLPVATMILSLFLLLEVYNIAMKFDQVGNGIMGATLGLDLPLQVMIKAVLWIWAVNNVPALMELIYNVTQSLIHEMGTGDTGQFVQGLESPATDLVLEQLRESLLEQKIGLGTGLVMTVKVTLIGLVVRLAMVLVNVIIQARFLEIYIMVAIAPLPVATLPHPELGGIAKNFFKSFAAVCLQGVFLYLVLLMFPTLLASLIIEDLTTGIWTMLAYCLVLIICIFSTGRWAKSVCNAM